MAKLDLTTGSILQHFFKIGIPASIGFIFNTFYNITDTWYGGKISDTALGGLSLSFPAFLIVLALGSGIGTAATVHISNSVGAKNHKDEMLFLTQSLFLGISISLLLMLSRKLYVTPLFLLMGASGDDLLMAVSYMEMIIIGLPFFISNNILNAFLNAHGNTKSYRNVLIVGFFLNLGLDPLFLYGYGIIPAMGISGVALATVSIQMIATVYLLFEIAKFTTPMGTNKGEISVLAYMRLTFLFSFKPHKDYIRQIIQQGFPALLNSMSVALGMFVINYYLNKYASTDAVAAYGVGLRIEQVFLLPAMGISIAILSIAGQNFGAKKYERIKEAYRIGLLIGVVTLIIAAIVLLPFSASLVAHFTKDTTIQKYAVFYLRLEIIAYYCYILLPASNSLLQGIKKPSLVMWMGFLRQLIAPAIVFYILCSVMGMGARAIFIGIAAINWFAALVSLCYTLYSLKKLA